MLDGPLFLFLRFIAPILVLDGPLFWTLRFISFPCLSHHFLSITPSPVQWSTLCLCLFNLCPTTLCALSCRMVRFLPPLDQFLSLSHPIPFHFILPHLISHLFLNYYTHSHGGRSTFLILKVYSITLLFPSVLSHYQLCVFKCYP